MGQYLNNYRLIRANDRGRVGFMCTKWRGRETGHNKRSLSPQSCLFAAALPHSPLPVINFTIAVSR
jgi:hypothetical protein